MDGRTGRGAARRVAARRGAVVRSGSGRACLCAQVVSAAPEVAEDVAARRRALEYWDPAQKRLHYNPTHEQMHAPLEGPANPFSADGLSAGQKNHRCAARARKRASERASERVGRSERLGRVGVQAGLHRGGAREAGGVPRAAEHLQRVRLRRGPRHQRHAGLLRLRRGGRGRQAQEEGRLQPLVRQAAAAGARASRRPSRRSAARDTVRARGRAGGGQVVLTEEERERQREFQAAREEAAKRAAEGGAAAPEHQEDSTKFHGKEETDYAGMRRPPARTLPGAAAARSLARLRRRAAALACAQGGRGSTRPRTPRRTTRTATSPRSSSTPTPATPRASTRSSSSPAPVCVPRRARPPATTRPL
eukprot:scaffold4014_cov323-Prasinococcus_capsulatus_cf.AAC.2